MRHKTESLLASITGLHFVLETGYHFQYGQPLPALIVDYIWIGLAVFGGIISLRVRPRSAAGLLAASWGFAAGFAWRSAFGRLAQSEADRAAGNGEPLFVTYVVLGALVLAFCLLLWSMWLTYKYVRV